MGQPMEEITELQAAFIVPCGGKNRSLWKCTSISLFWTQYKRRLLLWLWIGSLTISAAFLSVVQEWVATWWPSRPAGFQHTCTFGASQVCCHTRWGSTGPIPASPSSLQVTVAINHDICTRITIGVKHEWNNKSDCDLAGNRLNNTVFR